MAAMMGTPKPLASLSSGLLARKGQAKPAMRPQGFAGFGNVGGHVDDLGWNDMGHGDAAQQPTAYQPAAPVALPPVLRDRQVLREEIEAVELPPVAAAPVTAEPVAPTLAPSPRTARPTTARQQARHKAAFTLRLDAERHLRLRLASALCNRSSQVIVTEALDAFLKSLPDVEGMASKLSARVDGDQEDKRG